MNIKYKFNNDLIQSHLEKYLKASNQKLNLLDKYIVKHKKDYISYKNETRELELFDDYIIFTINETEKFNINLLSIEDIVVSDNDIMLINSKTPIFIPSYAFESSNERSEFTKKLEKTIKIAKLKIKREIVNAESGYYVSNAAPSDKFITLSKGYTQPHSSYCSYRLLSEKNIYKPLKKAVILRSLFWILVTSFFSFLAFNSMGAFNEKTYYISLSIGIVVLILVFYFIYLHTSIRTRGKYLNTIKRDKFQNVNFKLEIFEGNIFIDENGSIKVFKISNLVKLEKKKKGLLLVFKDKKNKLSPYFFYKAKNINDSDIDEIFYILKTMQEYYEKDFKKIETLKTVPKYYFIIKKALFILAIIAFPLTLFIVPKAMPTYYSKISNAKHLEQMKKARVIIDANLYDNKDNSYSIDSTNPNTN